MCSSVGTNKYFWTPDRNNSQGKSTKVIASVTHVQQFLSANKGTFMRGVSRFLRLLGLQTCFHSPAQSCSYLEIYLMLFALLRIVWCENVPCFCRRGADSCSGCTAAARSSSPAWCPPPPAGLSPASWSQSRGTPRHSSLVGQTMQQENISYPRNSSVISDFGPVPSNQNPVSCFHPQTSEKRLQLHFFCQERFCRKSSSAIRTAQIRKIQWKPNDVSCRKHAKFFIQCGTYLSRRPAGRGCSVGLSGNCSSGIPKQPRWSELSAWLRQLVQVVCLWTLMHASQPVIHTRVCTWTNSQNIVPTSAMR